MAIDTRTAMIDAHRAYAESPTDERRAVAREAGRAHEAERIESRRVAKATAYRAACERVQREIAERLACPLPAESRIGVCSRKHAEYLGMAASVAGGYVATGSHFSDELQQLLGANGYGADMRYLVMPADMGNRAAVSRQAAAKAVRATLARLSDPLLDEERADMCRLLDLIEGAGED